ncbi:MAG: amidohydrolase family protein [Gemmatimonadota bacterium]|nr:amidohydrolase family protein [Gemmatimonadota bacterium]
MSPIKAILVALLAATPLSAQHAPPIAITGVTIVDPSVAASRQAGMTDQTILIRNGIIEAVGPSIVIPRGTRQIDGRGKFVIPGLWDAHVHFMNTGPSALPRYVALGVTSVREMGGYIDSTRAWQARMRAGRLVGPRILTPGPILEAPRYLASVRERSVRDPRISQRVLPFRLSVGTAADARKAVDSLVKLHVDFVKVRTEESPEAYFAILHEARLAGLKVAGHAPYVVSVTVAVDSGQRDIEHALAPPLSRLPAEARDSVYLEFAKWGTWYTPTLVATRVSGLTADSAKRGIFSEAAIRDDERQSFASQWLLDWWSMQVQERIADTSAATNTNFARELYASSVADVRRMHELGVLLLAGTDAGSVLVYPGFALHEELRLLVEDVGLTPLEALWSATVGPARFAGLDATLGSIATGKIADLVLLDANPLENIRNTRRVSAVVQGGHFYARKDLDALLDMARRKSTVPRKSS